MGLESKGAAPAGSIFSGAGMNNPWNPGYVCIIGIGYAYNSFASDDAVIVVMPFNGKVKNLFVVSHYSADDIVEAYIRAMVRKNGADTSLIITLTGAAKDGSNEVDAVSFSKGDKICMQLYTPTGGNTVVHWGCEIIKT